MKASNKFEWYLVFAYDHGANKKGDIYSRHKGYGIAASKCTASKYNSFLAIRHYHEILK